MSGGPIPALNSDGNGGKPPEDGDKPDVVARLDQRFAQNDPRLKPPEPPQDDSVTPGVAGFRREDIGLGAKSTVEIDALQADRASRGIQAPQASTDSDTSQDSIFSGTSQRAQIAAYNLETSGQGGSISGKAFGSENNEQMTDAEKKERERETDLILLELELEQMRQEADKMSAQSDEMSAQFAQNEVTVTNSFEDMGAILAEQAALRNAQLERLEQMKRDLAEGKPGVTAQQVADAQAQFDQTNATFMANTQSFGKLSSAYDETKTAVETSRARMDTLKESIANASGEDLARLRLELAEERLKFAEVSRKVTALEATAHEMVAAVQSNTVTAETKQPSNEFSITGQNNTTYTLANTAGGLALVAAGGAGSIALSALDPDTQALVKEKIVEGIAQGRAFAPDVVQSLAAVGIVADNAARDEKARLDQQALEKQAVERMMAGGSMGAEEYERMKRILGANYAEELAKENHVKVQTGILADIGLGFMQGPAKATTGFMSTFLFTNMALQLAGREIPTWSPETSTYGISAGFSGGSFADSMDFNKYNPLLKTGEALPSYAVPVNNGIPMGFALASMFGLGGPSQQQGTAAFELEQQRLRMAAIAPTVPGQNGPTPPNGNAS